MVVLDRQPLLLKIIRTLHSSCRLAGRLHGRQQQSNQNPYDGNHDQELHQRETLSPFTGTPFIGMPFIGGELAFKHRRIPLKESKRYCET
jgi:hypothetical protein